nr:MAG TPA: hypothetical protein [Caudoviricetes sp.]
MKQFLCLLHFCFPLLDSGVIAGIFWWVVQH